MTIERVADITDAGAIEEGVLSLTSNFIEKNFPLYNSKMEERIRSMNLTEAPPIGPSPREKFKALWQSINGKPKPIQHKKNGKMVTTGYIVYPFDEQCGKEWETYNGKYKGLPLQVICNPWVFVIGFEVLSTTGKPDNLN